MPEQKGQLSVPDVCGSVEFSRFPAKDVATDHFSDLKRSLGNSWRRHLFVFFIKGIISLPESRRTRDRQSEWGKEEAAAQQKRDWQPFVIFLTDRPSARPPVRRPVGLARPSIFCCVFPRSDVSQDW